MPSLRNAIVAACKAAIDQAGKPAGSVVRRYMTQTETEEKSFNVLPLGQKSTEEVRPGAGYITTHMLTVGVVVRARQGGEAAKGLAPDELLDPLLVWAVQALMADPTLGGIAIGVAEDEITWDVESFDQEFARALQTFTVMLRTNATDPTSEPSA